MVLSMLNGIGLKNRLYGGNMAKLMMSEQEKQVIDTSEVFLAMIMPNFVKDPSKYESCRYAKSKGKLMYAIVEDDVDWSKFKDFDWRKIYHTWKVTGELIAMIVKEIREDIKFFKGSGGK